MKEKKPKTKLVIRLLPPQLTEEQFRETISKYLNEVDFCYFCPGKQTEKKLIHSRAYVNFTSVQAAENFFLKFNGHVFVTNKGKENKTVVEYAPYQKISNGPFKQDLRENTIEQDPDYLQFLEQLQQPLVTLPSAEVQLEKRLQEERELAAANGGVIPPQTTPLLEALRAQKLKGRVREGKGRNGKSSRKEKEKTKDVDKIKRREKGSRKKDREEKRKKKKEEGKEGSDKKFGEESKESKSKKEKEDGRPKNGIWIRRHLEPGSVTIQAREIPKQDSSITSSPPSNPTIETRSNPSQQWVAKGQNGTIPQNHFSRKGGRRGGPRGEIRIYAPKQQTDVSQLPQIPVNN